MLLRWQSKPKFDVSRPASGRLPTNSGHREIPASLALRAAAPYTNYQTPCRVRRNHSYMTVIASFESDSRVAVGCALAAKNLVPKE